MGAFFSYYYYHHSSSAKNEEEAEEKEAEGTDSTNVEIQHKKCSDPSFTILYPPQEKEFLRQVEEEEQERERRKQSTNKISSEVWDRMTTEDKRKHLRKQRVKKSRQKKSNVLDNKRKELLPWLEGLTAKERANIKEVVWKMPEDASLAEYIKKSKDALIQCPNRYCSLFFERIPIDNKKKAPLVLGEDGKPLKPEALNNFMDNRFKCVHCETIFCNECHAIPYHLGETCDEHKLRLTNPPCKVCKKPLPPPPDTASAAKHNVTCLADDCLKLAYNLCPLKATCTHSCTGIKGQVCMCLRPSCIAEQGITQQGGDFCNICWTDELDAGTCMKLTCGHIFHRHCVEQKLKHRWTGARISFNYANCPLCQVPIGTTCDYTINSFLNEVRDLKNEVKLKAQHFLKIEGMVEDIKNPNHEFYNRPVDYALHVFSFYQCFKCKSPYYGGKRQCGDILNFNPEELLCGGCSGLLSCEKEKHGKKYIHYKCRFCCSIASWFCFGRVHYCENCHNNPYEYWACNNMLVGMPPQCKGKEFCPLGVEHPPNGFEEMSLGCSRCKLEEAGVVMEDDNDNENIDDDDDIFY